jgi:ABC-2 type transport system permease protein
MHPDIPARPGIAWLDLSGRRRALIGYCLGMAVYALAVVAMYPAFKTSSSLDKFIASDPTAAAVFGISGSISTSGGWLSGNIYANFFPLVMLLLTIGYGATCLAGQDEDGTLGLLAVLPVRRTVIVAHKAAAMAAQAAVLAATVAVLVIIGRSFQLEVTISNVVSASAAVLLMGLDFGLVTMAAGALAGRRGTAIGAGTALAAASYLISSLAPVTSWIRPGKYASLFYWSVGNSQISHGVSASDYAVLVTVGLCALTAAMLAFRRLDIH